MATQPSTQSNTGTEPTMFPSAGRAPFFAVSGVILATALSALAIFWDVTSNDPEPEEHPVGQFLVAVAVIVVATAILYAVVVRTADRGNPGRRSLILGIVAVATVVVFWLGVPVVVASAAAATAFVERDLLGRLSRTGTAGLVLATIATVVTVGLAIAG